MSDLGRALSEWLSPSSGGSINLISGLIAAYLGGVLASLTPCIYPMIPITVSVVGGFQPTGARPSWRKLVARGSAYVLGMTFIYAILGVVAGLTGQIFGSLTQTPGWYMGLGIIMTLAGLMMMDVIPFDPQALIERLSRRNSGGKSKVREGGTLLGAFSLGASSGFIAAPCTTPVMTSILAYIAKTQSVGFGLLLMTAFALGLGTLLLVVATFAGSLQMMPKSGRWMNAIKVASGLLLLGFAHYLFFQAGASSQ